MANRTSPVDRSILDDNLVTPTSRYIDSKLIYYGLLNKMTLTTYRVKPITSRDGDKYTIIHSGHAYRPDLLSSEVYGTPDFWWKIMEHNNMKDIMEFKTGTNVVLPGDVLF